jgi:hypothetical protein
MYDDPSGDSHGYDDASQAPPAVPPLLSSRCRFSLAGLVAACFGEWLLQVAPDVSKLAGDLGVTIVARRQPSRHVLRVCTCWRGVTGVRASRRVQMDGLRRFQALWAKEAMKFVVTSALGLGEFECVALEPMLQGFAPTSPSALQRVDPCEPFVDQFRTEVERSGATLSDLASLPAVAAAAEDSDAIGLLVVLGLMNILVTHRRYDARHRTVLRKIARNLGVNWTRVGALEDALLERLGGEILSMQAANSADRCVCPTVAACFDVCAR